MCLIDICETRRPLSRQCSSRNLSLDWGVKLVRFFLEGNIICCLPRITVKFRFSLAFVLTTVMGVLGRQLFLRRARRLFGLRLNMLQFIVLKLPTSLIWLRDSLLRR